VQTKPQYDVAIIGGGPAGATVASLLRKYRPALSVAIFEKERFPRDHIGESQLPGILSVLNEMGAWEKVERAGFPIKIGASYTWGRNQDRWDFDFYPVEHWRDEPRPGRYAGQRTKTAFQVDRALYDEILLQHAGEMGAEVFQDRGVVEVLHEGDRVTGLRTTDGAVVTARFYVDASGVVAILRRTMGVGVWAPDELKNIAVWNYWRNAEWAVKIGVGATRVQVRSLPYGWIWFIPLGPTRTSVGLITPAAHYKSTGLSPAEIYEKALGEQPEIAALLENAEVEGDVFSCKDWSQVTDRLTGENWFLVGEVVGFADTILAAGMNLAHQSARDLAYTILELDRGVLSPDWLKARYDERNRLNVQQHVRFAQYWYVANSNFTDLKEHCRGIAQDAGLSLSPVQAWRWLSQGGFAAETPGLPLLGSFDLSSAREILDLFSSEKETLSFEIDRFNVFHLDTEGAERDVLGVPEEGRIKVVDCFRRDGRVLPMHRWYQVVYEGLQVTPDLANLMQWLRARISTLPIPPAQRDTGMHMAMQTLETMCVDGWVSASLNPNRPRLDRKSHGNIIRSGAEGDRALAQRQASAAPRNGV